MIIKEYYKTRKDGVVLERQYSDQGFFIERNNVKYAEAIDPEYLHRTYTETSELIPVESVDDSVSN